MFLFFLNGYQWYSDFMDWFRTACHTCEWCTSTLGFLFWRHAIFSLDRDSHVHRTVPSSVARLWSRNTQVWFDEDKIDIHFFSQNNSCMFFLSLRKKVVWKKIWCFNVIALYSNDLHILNSKQKKYLQKEYWRLMNSTLPFL